MPAARDRYPEFAAAALERGIESTISLPLVAGGHGIGALNLYSSARNGFDDEDAAVGERMAAATAVVLANALAYWSVVELSEGLAQAMESRAVIEQAKGVLMAGNPEIDPDSAFDVLRRASMRENVKVRDIARRIVERRSPGPDG